MAHLMEYRQQGRIFCVLDVEAEELTIYPPQAEEVTVHRDQVYQATSAVGVMEFEEDITAMGPMLLLYLDDERALGFPLDTEAEVDDLAQRLTGNHPSQRDSAEEE